MATAGYAVCPKCGYGSWQEWQDTEDTGRVPVPFHRWMGREDERPCHGAGMSVPALGGAR